ncbi:MAG: 30S ribosomal protein S6 [Halanaerobiales bacterium]|nr:30S ribosomal protein S6 [Halanaerobiales bacterium]
MIRQYEATYILKPDMEQEARESLTERIKGIITDHNGEILEVDDWGSRKLAYEIKDYKNGYYTIITFKGDASLVNELERNFKIIDDVLRYLVINTEN